MPPSALRHFHPLIQQWFIENVGDPTDVQLRAWDEISRQRHVLVTAPTGSGKTLAAFLWAINQLVTGAWPRGETKVLYVSPLKALNNDVRRNLLAPLNQLREFFAVRGEKFPAIAVQTRSGDTPGDERRRMLRHPPEILITTPESLNILVTSKGSRATLTGVATVILDEIHAVAGDKRGTHLITAVERLTLLSGEFQRIALSATVRPLETIADFVAGLRLVGQRHQPRPISLVRGEQEKRFELEISAPSAVLSGADEEFWPALVERFTDIITRHRSTLFFANSRRTTEKVTRLINELSGEELAYSHHGSLSREIRLAVEERLKRGELKAIVATNSLELGIDIGKLDSVVLIQTPRSISSAIQRIGRSGHGVGEVSSGMLFPTYGMDFVCAAVIARAIAEGEIEELHPVEAPLDLLAQIMLAMGLPELWHLDELYDFLRCSYPYRNLSRQQFDLVVGMLEGKYADSHVPELRPRVTVDRLEETIVTRPALSMLVYLEGGTIPERGYFELRLKESGAKIGELDEEFVWERRLGDTFALGAQVWQITEISHSTVLVVPARKSQQIIPFWRAEELDRDIFYSEKISSFLESCNERLGRQDLVEELMRRHFMDEGAAKALESYLELQREATGAPLPHRHHLLVEHFRDPVGGAETEQIILHTLWGNTVNRPFTFALVAAWERRYGYPLQAFYNNDGIALLLPHEMEQLDEILELVTPDNIESLLRESLEGTGYFGARFRENAGRALLLSRSNFKRRMPLWLNRLRSKKLLASVLRYRDFPVLLETWRSALKDDFDLANLRRVLEEIQDGTIEVSRVHTKQASPFAKGLIWQQTNKYVYEDETLGGGRKSAIGSDFLKELALSPHLRPHLPPELVRQFQEKRQRLAPGYAPDSARELIDWVKERLLVPLREWPDLLRSVARDGGPGEEESLLQVAQRLVLVEFPGAEAPMVSALEMIPEVAEGLGCSRDEITIAPLIAVPDLSGLLQQSLDRLWQRTTAAAEIGDEEEPGAARIVGRWLGYYGPMELAVLQRTLGLEEGLLRDALQSLEETGSVLVDRFTGGGEEPQVCDAVNLEALLRMLRRSRRPAFEALDLAQLPLFLAQFQGIVQQGSTPDDLRDRLEQLLGAPLPVGLWEEDVLPARLAPYLGAWLDSLMQSSDLLWFGCGPRRLSFAFPEDLDLFQEQDDSGTGATEPEHPALIPDDRGHYNLSAICSIAGVTAATATTELWQAAWKGAVSNDSFAAVRKGILNRFELPQGDAGHRHPVHGRHPRRLPGSRWNRAQEGPGNWFVLPEPQTEIDVLEKEERTKDRVRVLLERYGILFRELLTRELPALQWSRLFRTLRIMEMSGELISGNFFDGIPGLQFVSQEAYRLLERGLLQDEIFWVNAADPASLCGSGLEGLREALPSRIPSTHLVYHGSHLVLISRRYGKELEFRTGADDSRLESYLALFRTLVSRDFNPLKRITVERINGDPAKESEYAEALRRFGFQESYSGLEYWRQYP
ncbi:DEAD/DEAH box helicase [Geomonas anaerohicana]|uniref:DEAD/DEAH box helicase n=1 Tax=Geomonas anaerohicana TaxID=2798583 RepID=A0ABS0YBJ1_9BACT|nr:DEAD/DEAH box helicase [Geomonas anaerohicana]MBJ6749646.1 DEAD/DEAH box helicase [Geomonas anaerohicana]